jgi:hypothetical protein
MGQHILFLAFWGLGVHAIVGLFGIGLACWATSWVVLLMLCVVFI